MTHDTPNTMNSVISTPVFDDGYVYGLDNDGQLRCLDAATGKLIWKTDALLKEHAMYGTAFFVRNGDRYFINNDRGELVLARLSPARVRGDRPHEADRADAPLRAAPTVVRTSSGRIAAYANRHIVVRNDKEIVRFSLAAEP